MTVGKCLSSVSSQCLSPLRSQRATVAGVKFSSGVELTQTNNLRPAQLKLSDSINLCQSYRIIS